MLQRLTSNQVTEKPSPILANPIHKSKQPVDVAADIAENGPVLLDEFCDGELALEEGIGLGILGDLFMRIEWVKANEMDQFSAGVPKGHVRVQLGLQSVAGA